MNIPTYSPSAMVRIELLRYENPEGLHPVELNWRDLARELLSHVEELQTKLDSVKGQSPYDKELKEWKPMKFPQPFRPTV